MQLQYYRTLIKSEAAKQGKKMHNWVGDPTTESYAYAYIEKEGGTLVIFQGRSANDDSIYRSVVTVPHPAISPDMLAKSGQISTPQVRRDFGGISKSIGVTRSEFTAIQDIVSSALSSAHFEELQAKDGGYPQVLSVTIV